MIDWQAEDEALHTGDEEQAGWKPAKNRRPVLLFLLALLLLLLPAGFWGYQQFQARNRVLALQAVEEQYLLLREAAILGDAELFTERNGDGDTMRNLTSRDLLVTSHSWLDREPLGLSWDRTNTPIISVTLSTDGREAELTAIESYTPIQVEQDTTAVQLLHRLVFKWEFDQWVFHHPGITETFVELLEAERPRVSMSYPNGDSELAKRLADDFDTLVKRICTELEDIQCAPQFQLAVQLRGQPTDLLQREMVTTSNPVLLLPTPAIVGLPRDEVAYAALRDGYAPLVVRATVAQLTGWECCEGQVFFEALLDQQLRELGLPAGLPVNPDFAHLVRKKVRPDDLYGLWGLSPARISSESSDRAQAVVGFMAEQEPEISIAEWQRRLAEANNYQEWAGEIAETNRSPRLRAAWLGYLYSHSNIAVVEAEDRPDREVVLLCSTEKEAVGEEQLYRFAPDNDSLTPMLSGRSFQDGELFATLDHGVLLMDGLQGDRLRLFAVDNGAVQPLWETQHPDSRSWFEPSPLGNYVFINFYFADAGITNSSMLDVAACHRGDCNLQSLPDDSAPPVWSPDEQHFLFVQDETLYLQAIAEETQETVLDPPDEGYYDFSWLDNNTYAFSRIRETGGSETIHWNEPFAVRIGDEQPTLLFDPAELLALLPIDDSAPTWAQIRPHPLEPGRLYIIFEYWESRTFYVLDLERNTGTTTLIYTAEDADTNQFTISPDGRWFSHSREGEIVLYDTVSQRSLEIEEIPGVTRPVWSPDSQWLFIISENILHLTAPLSGTNHRYVDDEHICSQGVWLP